MAKRNFQNNQSLWRQKTSGAVQVPQENSLHSTDYAPHPFVPAALELLNDLNGSESSAADWADRRWNTEWESNTSRLHDFITDVSQPPPGMRLPRLAWVRLNRLRTGIGRFRSTMHRWGLSHSAACECGAEEQTADHVITTCPKYHLANGTDGLLTMCKGLTSWLLDTCPDI